ncbi:MAG: leucine-rich repeat protein [Ruminococcus flavefaciens]
MSVQWTITGGRLTHEELPEPIAETMTKPYPPGWWYVENGRLTHSALPPLQKAGAFCGCMSLRQVSIPESVKSIGEFAFADTALTRVKIAGDCSYFPSTFPENFTIMTY